MAETDMPPQGAGPAGAAGPPTAEPSGPQEPEVNKDARMWAMFCHLAGLAFLVVPAIGAVLGPLVIWLLKKEEFPFVDDQGKEAVNFQITMLIYGVIAFILCFACIGTILLPVVGLIDIVLVIMAAIKANDGYRYRYPKPFIIRLIK
jgi:uncharacterized Tic20 family protein